MELIDILDRLRKGDSIKKIHRESKHHRVIIRGIKNLGESKGWLDPSTNLPSEGEILKAREAEKAKESSGHGLDDFKEKIKNWLEKSYSLKVIHTLISSDYSCSESTVRRYIKAHFPQKRKPVMLRHDHSPGDVMEVDFGYLGLMWDLEEKRQRKAWLFSARLRYSRKAWREVVFSQDQDVFFECHQNAFDYFDGVPARVVPDNLKAAVIKASHEDPLVNRAYRSLARHYGFKIDPCLPRTPNHKGGVENDIKYVKNNFYPVFVERQREKGHHPPWNSEVMINLKRWSTEIADQRQINGVGRSPDELFTEEYPSLKPLPIDRWETEKWLESTIRGDWRIQYEKRYYSVPYQLIDKKVMFCVSGNLVRVFYDHELIATHTKVKDEWGWSRIKSHAPPNQEDYMSQTRQGLISQAEKLGDSIGVLVRHIIERKEVDGLRPARKLIALKNEFGIERLEQACSRAIQYETLEYFSVKNILYKKLDDIKNPVQVSPEAFSKSPQEQNFRFSRDPKSFISSITLIFTGGSLWMILLY